MTEINANSPLHNINPPITGINPPLENGNPVNPVNNGVSAPEQNVVQKGTEAKSLSLKLDSMMIRAAQLDEIGISADFRKLKAAADELLERYDHRCLNDLPEFAERNPTSENLAKRRSMRRRSFRRCSTSS